MVFNLNQEVRKTRVQLVCIVNYTDDLRSYSRLNTFTSKTSRQRRRGTIRRVIVPCTMENSKIGKSDMNEFERHGTELGSFGHSEIKSVTIVKT